MSADVYVYAQHRDANIPSVEQKEVAEGVTLDYDPDGKLIGVEILGAEIVTINGYEVQM